MTSIAEAPRKLAIAGGEPITDKQLFMPAWPPTDDVTERDLIEVYRGRKWSFNGPQEVAFGAEFAAAHDAQYGVVMANGTVTLQCALGAHGVGPGDEVIVPALTWPATAMAAVYLGAIPVFVDIEADTLCIDPAAVEAAITPRTRAIVAVHLYGGMADLDALGAIAARHGLPLIEDCAHAHGGKWNGKGVGSIGAVGSFSFQESKTVASGEGGICLTNDEELAGKLYRMKHIGYASDAGQGGANSGPPMGLPVYNFRGTEFQAVILRHQTRGLAALIEKYNRNADRITERLSGQADLVVQARGRKADPQSYYGMGFTARRATADKLIEALSAEGLNMFSGTYGVVYQHILFNLEPGAYRVQGESCKVAEDIGSARTIVMPHQWLGSDEANIETIAAGLRKVAGGIDSLSAT